LDIVDRHFAAENAYAVEATRATYKLASSLVIRRTSQFLLPSWL
jgi:hypothetical protein